jgi:hypothetical protein
MKFNDVVIYSESGKDYNALILGEREGRDNSGSSGEPLLTLQFGKERLDGAGNPLPVHGTGQTPELVKIRLDVAHISAPKEYDGGRWSLPVSTIATPLPATSVIEIPASTLSGKPELVVTSSAPSEVPDAPQQ